jgi:hypothetical protein
MGRAAEVDTKRLSNVEKLALREITDAVAITIDAAGCDESKCFNVGCRQSSVIRVTVSIARRISDGQYGGRQRKARSDPRAACSADIV